MLRWEQVDPALIDASVDPETEPVLFALAEAARYDIWAAPVILQLMWTSRLDQIVLLVPDASSPRRLEPPVEWKIEVFIPRGLDAVPQVVTSGTVTLPAPSSPTGSPGRAVLIAASLAAGHGRDLAPTLIDVREEQSQYHVWIEGLPGMPGGYTLVYLSKDLSHYRMAPSF